MRVKLTIEDSSERWIVLDEAEARELQQILKNIFNFGYKPNYDLLEKNAEASKAEESPETLRDPGSPHNIYNCYRYDCVPCKTLMGPKGTC